MYKLLQFQSVMKHLRSWQDQHGRRLLQSCKLQDSVLTSGKRVRNHSTFSENIFLKRHSRRKNTSVITSTHKMKTNILQRFVRHMHDDPDDKLLKNDDKNSYLDDDLGDRLADEELSEYIQESEFPKDTESELVQKRSQMPSLLINESSLTKSSPSMLSDEMDMETVTEGLGIETDCDGSAEGLEDDQNEMLERRQSPSNWSSQKDIEKYLTDVEMSYDLGHTGYYTLCPKFGKLKMKKKNKKKEERLYINSTSGYFFCRHCMASGSWAQLRDNIEYIRLKKANRRIECFKNIPDMVKDTDEGHPQVEKLLSGALDFSSMSDETFDNVTSIFEWHGIEKKTFVDYGIKYKIVDNEYKVMFPTHSPTTGSVMSVSVYTGKIMEDGDIKTDPVHSYPRGKVAHLFGWLDQSKLRRAKQNILVITTSEVDAMSVWQATGILALSLKNITQLPQETLPHLEDFSKVILWLGTDVKAWDNTKIFAKKLGDDRCYVFRPTVLKYMPLEMLQMGDHIQEVLYLPKLMSNNSIVTFNDVRQEVYSEFAHFQQVAGVQWKRYKKLNTLLKGHRRGELTILTGQTGSGKTTFMSEYSLDLCMQGVNTLWGSFEISNVRLIKMMMQQFAEKSISKHLDEFDKIAEEFSTLPMYFMMYYGQEKLKNVLEAMSHAVYIHDIGHVVLDNLQFMMGMDYNERNRFFRQDQIVSEFRNFATEKNCHVTLIIHPRKVNEGEELSTACVFGSAKVTQEADNILLVQNQRTLRSTRKYIQVAKNRFDGDLGIMTLSFNKDSLTFTTVDKKKGSRTEEESDMRDETEDVT